MKRLFRLRPGVGDDVVYEMRYLFWCWLPNWMKVGYFPYANAASCRNRISADLNKEAEKMKEMVRKLAKAEQSLNDERIELKNSKYDHLGVGKPFPMDPKEIKSMLPYVSEPKPHWKKFVAKNVVNEVFKEFKVSVKDDNPILEHSFVVPKGIYEDHQDLYDLSGAKHVFTYDADKKKSEGKSQNKSKGKANIKSLRKEFPRDEDESQPDWDNRLQDIANKRNNS